MSYRSTLVDGKDTMAGGIELERRFPNARKIPADIEKNHGTETAIDVAVEYLIRRVHVGHIREQQKDQRRARA
jgi:hypothetical protein